MNLIFQQMKEILSFFYEWLIKGNNYVEFSLWFVNKLKLRIARSITPNYSNFYYPREIKEKLLCVQKANPDKSLFYGEINKNLKYTLPFSIQLAGSKLQINKNINWNEKLQDPEDIESLHRWNWLLHILSTRNLKNIYLLWCIEQIHRWIKMHQYEILYDKRKADNQLHWKSYTIGERISNLIIFFHLTKAVPTSLIQNSINQQVNFLLNRFEYSILGFGNHLFNNARAIYLAGVIFNCSSWKNFAETVIKRDFKKLITVDGFLREGSSHYQYLFSRWVLEVLYFAYLAGDLPIINFFKPIVYQLLRNCLFFRVISKDGRNTIPLFGDISPDFSPKWLENIVENPITSLEKVPSLHESSWNRLWTHLRKPLVRDDDFKSPDYQSAGIFAYPESGWYRFNVHGYTLFIRGERDYIPSHSSHYHQDAGHFCLYYRGMPVLVDGGRLNYMDTFGISPAAHNSIMLDGFGLVHSRPHRYPLNYSNCENQITYQMEESDLRVVFESDGFARLRKGILWKRQLCLGLREFRITDRLEGKGNFTLRTWFHWDADAEVVQEYDSEYKINLSHTTASFMIHTKETQNVQLFKGGNSLLGWQTIAYGKRLPAATLEIVTQIQLPVVLEYSLVWD